MKLILALLATLTIANATNAQTTNRFAATIFSVRTNDLSITNQTNATATGLTFATQANQKYIVTLLPIIESASAASSIVLQVVTSNSTAFGNWNGIATSFASATSITNELNSAITAARAPIQTFYVVAGTNGGSVSLQFRGSATNNTNIIKAGSFMRADKVPQ